MTPFTPGPWRPSLLDEDFPVMNSVLGQPDILLMVLLSIGTFLWAYFRRPGRDDDSGDGGRPVPDSPVTSPTTPSASGDGAGDGSGDGAPVKPEAPTPSEREPVSA